jgi:hypothetical protein
MRQQELELENSKLKAEIKALRIEDLESVSLPKVLGAYSHWLFNADSDFIEKVWKDNPMLVSHLRDKLHGMCKDFGFMATNILARFDRELSENNREILYKYILENHLNKW